ncbi:MAG: OmpA family protein [Crocinitomicaceae bacterium]
MLKKSALFSIIFSCLVFATGIAQINETPIELIKMKELKGLAKNALRLGDGYTALYYYSEWVKRRPQNTEVMFQVAELNRYTRNYKEAEFWYSSLSRNFPEKYPTAVFYLAQMQVMQGEYTKAKQNYLIFKKLLKYVDDIYFKNQYKVGITSCDFAISMKDSVSSAVAVHLPKTINKPHVEFSPVVLDENTIIFGSLDVAGVDYYNINAHDSMNIPFRKFYTAKKIDGEWVNKGELLGPFNQNNAHVGNATISVDGKKMYFTVCEKNWKNEMVCRIFYSNKYSRGWSEATMLDESINLPNYTSTQPTIGYDSRTNGEVIYFVSNRPGGRGGLDIWYTEYNTRRKEFKNPKNLGSKINSKGDEATPYYDKSTRSLYFSSNGKTGYGGYDVYKTSGEKRKWTEVLIMDKGINTSYDDLDFTLNSDKSGGFLVSNRKGGTSLLSETCCDDIYEITFSEFIKIDIKGNVRDNEKALTDFDINLYLKDPATGDKFVVKQNNFTTSDYQFGLDQGYEYIIEVSKKGYYKKSASLKTTDIKESTELIQDFLLEKIPHEPVVVKGILYEFDSDELTAGAKTTIDTTLYKLLMDQENIVIQILSHTDSKGKNSYNRDLSNRRARSVVYYLSEKGIHPSRLKYKGYGESMPIAPNTNTDGSDNPEGRKLNRRTEFIVVGEIDFKILYEDLDESKKEKYKRGKKVDF